MPIEESISVRIKGDTSDLEKSVGKLDSILSSVGSTAQKATSQTANAFTNVSSTIGKVTSQLSTNVSQIQAFGQSVANYFTRIGAAPNINLDSVNQQIDNLQSKIDSARTEILITADPKEVLRLESELSVLSGELDRLKQSKVVLDVSSAIVSLDLLQTEIKRTEDKISSTKLEIKNVKLDVTADPTIIEGLQTKLQGLQANLDRLKSTKLSIEVGDFTSSIQGVDNLIRDLQSKLKAQTLLLNVETDPVKLEAVKSSISALETQVTGLKEVRLNIESATAVQSLKNVVNVTDDVTKAAAKMSSESARAGGALSNGFKDALGNAVNLANETERLEHTIETLRGKMLAKREFLVTEKDINKIKKYNQEIEELENEIERLQSIGKKGFDQLGKRVDKFGGTLNKMNKQNGAATQSLINLSRVAQDAPFGFIGIANNLNPLLESFQRLKAESKTTGGALKSLGQSLIGPAGLGLAIGVVSSLLISFGDKLFSSKSAAEKNAEALRKAKQALEDYQQSLSDTGKINLLGSQNAQAELIKLQTLFKAASDVNIPLQRRKEIVDQLQAQYPKYFANIKDETILAGGAKDAYDRLTSSIVATSRARAAQDSLVEIQKDLLTTEMQLADAQTSRNKSLNNLNKTVERSKQIQKGIIGGSTLGVSAINTQDVKAANELEKKQKDINALYDKRFELQRRINSVSALLTDIVIKNPDVIIDPVTGNPLKNTTVKAQPKEVEVDYRGVRVETLGIDVLREELRKGHEFDNLFVVQPRGLIVDYSKAKAEIKIPDEILKQQAEFIKSPFSFASPEAKAQLADMEQRMTNLAETVSGLAIPAFQNLFNAIIDGKQPLKSFFESLGQSVLQLINKLIAAAAQAAILSLLLPGGAGQVKGFLGFFGKALGFAHGGLVYGPTLGLVGEGKGTTRSNPEVIAPLNKLSQYLGGGAGSVEVYGRVRGGDILLSSAREGRRQGRVR